MRMSTLFRLFSVVMFLLVSVGWIGFGEGPIGSTALANAKSQGARASDKKIAKATGAKETVKSADKKEEKAADDSAPIKGAADDGEEPPKNQRSARPREDDYGRSEEGFQTDRIMRECREDLKTIEEGLRKCNTKCRTNAKNCGQGGAEDSQILGVLLNAYAGPEIGSTTTGVNCELTPDQWKTDEKDLKSQIKDAENQINKINKDIVENEDKTKKNIQELESEMIKGKKTAKEDQRKLDQQLRSSDEALLAAQNRTLQEIQKIMEEKSTMREKVNSTYSGARLQVMKLTDARIKSICTAQARAMLKKIKAEGSSASSSSGAAIKAGLNRKAMINEEYENCKQEAFAQRDQTLEAATRAVNSLNESLSAKDAELTRLQAQAALRVKNMSAAADELKVQKQETAAEFMEFQGQKQKEAQDALDSYNKVEANLKQEIKTEQRRIHQSQIQLNSLGLRPKVSRGSSGQTISDNYEDYVLALRKVPGFKNHCCQAHELGRPKDMPFLGEKICEGDEDLAGQYDETKGAAQ